MKFVCVCVWIWTPVPKQRNAKRREDNGVKGIDGEKRGRVDIAFVV